MSFPRSVKEEAFKRAGGKCEKCGKKVEMETCEAHHKTSVRAGGKDVLSNCQILCIECHQNTRTYGKH